LGSLTDDEKKILAFATTEFGQGHSDWFNEILKELPGDTYNSFVPGFMMRCVQVHRLWESGSTEALSRMIRGKKIKPTKEEKEKAEYFVSHTGMRYVRKLMESPDETVKAQAEAWEKKGVSELSSMAEKQRREWAESKDDATRAMGKLKNPYVVSIKGYTAEFYRELNNALRMHCPSESQMYWAKTLQNAIRKLLKWKITTYINI
jgi:hypothetical protein